MNDHHLDDPNDWRRRADARPHGAGFPPGEARDAASTNEPGRVAAALAKLKTVATLSIVLGALGLLSALFSAAALLAGTARIQAATAVRTATPAAADVTAEMNRALAASADARRPLDVALTLLSFAASAALAAGGALCLRRRERGRRLLRGAFLAGIPLETARGISNVVATVTSAQIAQGYVVRIAKASAPPGAAVPPEVEKLAAAAAAGATHAGLAVGLLFAAGWFVAQVVFYVAGLAYLRKPEVRETFR